jgi:Xaa-Pro aminopeptidase
MRYVFSQLWEKNQMFQDFADIASPTQGADRIERLREKMREAALNAYLVPHGDEHQNEYLPPCAERLAWLTGFTGSAGFCVITIEDAILFVDGRYTLQAARQTDPDIFTIINSIEMPPSKWLGNNMPPKSQIGYDPWTITIEQKRKLKKQIESRDAGLVACENLVDAIWHDRPAPPLAPVQLHPSNLAGRGSQQKIDDLNFEIAEAGADLCLISDPASIAWIFNIRGSDVAHNPLVLSFAILRKNERPILFIEPKKLNSRIADYLDGIAERHSPEELHDLLGELSRDAKIMCDAERTAAGFARLIEDSGGQLICQRDPAILLRAIKNETEIEGSRKAHLRDGVAMVRFLSWLDRQEPATVDEIGAAKKLEKIRTENARDMNSELREIAFDTISGAGANGAIIHYRVTAATNAIIEKDSLYLVDSGGQYADGTTDITRTILIGDAPQTARKDFTLVLKGHIAIATARFPEGTRGIDLDALARAALWRNGRDYGHGTGHGVGSYLCVHEGPQSISRRGMEILRSGMIISNEPGFYRPNQFGIRIENLVLVKPAYEMDDGNVAVHEFETLTLAPIDLRLVDPALLTEDEINWLNEYHARVRRELAPHLEMAEREWLELATRPIGGS